MHECSTKNVRQPGARSTSAQVPVPQLQKNPENPALIALAQLVH